MPLEMPTTTRNKLNAKLNSNGSERLVENEFIRCQEFNFRICDIDGFLWQEAGEFNPAQTIVYFKGYTASVPDSEKKLYDLLGSNLTKQGIE